MRHAGWQHTVERRDAVGSHYKQLVAQVVCVADFAPAEQREGEVCLEYGRGFHGVIISQEGEGIAKAAQCSVQPSKTPFWLSLLEPTNQIILRPCSELGKLIESLKGACIALLGKAVEILV